MTKTILMLLVLSAAAYLAVAGLIFAAQTRILFPGSTTGLLDPSPPSGQQLSMEANGEQLHGVHIAPRPGTEEGREVILGFGGNAWDAQAAAAYLHEVYPAHNVLVFHFRGYGPSTGTPSADALLQDAPLIHDFVVARFPGRPIVSVGFSIGSAVAARMARERSLAGLILVTPFDSLESVAKDHYRWLPVGLLLRHQMEPAEELRGLTVPVAIIAAERDELIPPQRTEGLRQSLQNIVFDRSIADAEHNDIYGRDAFRNALRNALTEIVSHQSPLPER